MSKRVMDYKMNQLIKKLAEQAYDLCDKRTYGSINSQDEFNDIFAKLVADYSASLCMSQQDRRTIRNAFGIEVESNIKYKGDDPSNSIESQYNRELNTKRINNNQTLTG